MADHRIDPELLPTNTYFNSPPAMEVRVTTITVWISDNPFIYKIASFIKNRAKEIGFFPAAIGAGIVIFYEVPKMKDKLIEFLPNLIVGKNVLEVSVGLVAFAALYFAMKKATVALSNRLMPPFHFYRSVTVT